MMNGKKSRRMFIIPRSSFIVFLVGFVRNWLAVDFGQSVHCGLLLGFLFVAAPGGRIVMPADDRRDLEALAVVGSLFVQELVKRGGAELALRDLLEQRFEVASVRFLDDVIDLRLQILKDEPGGRLQAAV